MFRDARHFWLQSPLRSASLFTGCIIVLALLTMNTSLFRSTHWFLPQGISGTRYFATLGHFSESGSFGPVSLNELGPLEGSEVHGRILHYGPDVTSARQGAREWKELKYALVNDNFFQALGIRMNSGRSFSPQERGVVISYNFWDTRLGQAPSAVGSMLQIQDLGLPILGIAPRGFLGLGDQITDLWVPESYGASFMDPPIPPGSQMDPKAARQVLSLETEGYYGIVLLHSPGERKRLSTWTVFNQDMLQLSVPNLDGVSSTQTGLLINRHGARPAVLEGIDVNPSQTQAIVRNLWLVTCLTLILILLALLSLVSFWNARLTERMDELRIRHAMGARWHDLAALFFREVTPFASGVLIVSLPLAYLQIQGVQRVEPFAAFFRNRNLHLGLQDMFPALGFLLALYVLGILIPLTAAMAPKALRSRAIGPSSGVQSWRTSLQGMQWMMVILVALAIGGCLLSNHRISDLSWGGTGDPLLVRVQQPDQQPAAFDALGIPPNEVPFIRTEPLGQPSLKTVAMIPGPAKRETISIYENFATPSALRLLGVPILAGSLYSPKGRFECVVSRALAEQLHMHPNELLGNPLVRLNPDGSETPPLQIVGVVDDIAYRDLKAAPLPMVYLSDDHTFSGPMTLVFPPSQKGRLVEAAKRVAVSMPELADSLASGVRVSAIQSTAVRSDAVLTRTALAYALCALGLLLMSLVAEAQTVLSHRGREMALVISVGARLEEAAFRLLRGPLMAIAISLILILPGSYLVRSRWISDFPMLLPKDIYKIHIVAFAVAFLFAMLLIGLAVAKLRRMTLSDLLRREQ